MLDDAVTLLLAILKDKQGQETWPKSSLQETYKKQKNPFKLDLVD